MISSEILKVETKPIYLISQNEKFICTELNEKVILEETRSIDIKELKHNYICRTVIELPSYMQTLFRVPNGKVIRTGDVYVAETLDNSIYGNLQVYKPETIKHSYDIPAIVINNGFETLNDNRRPNGNTDYTQYDYKENEVITAIRLLPEIKFELSPDNLENLETFINAWANGDNLVGTWLHPTTTHQLFWTNDFSNIETKVYMVIEAIKWFRLGGQSGSEFALTLIVRVKYKDLTEIVPIHAEIDEVEVEPFAEKLSLPLEQGSPVARITVTGGTAPFTYEIEEYEEYFDIEDEGDGVASIIMKKDYYGIEGFDLFVNVIDSNGKKGSGQRTIFTQPSPITDLVVNVTQGLMEGTDNVAPGATAATMSVTGRTQPFTYEFNDIPGNDNDHFVIENNLLKVGDSALIEASYKVSVQVKDRYNQILTKNLIVAVSANNL